MKLKARQRSVKGGKNAHPSLLLLLVVVRFAIVGVPVSSVSSVVPGVGEEKQGGGGGRGRLVE